MQDNTNEICHAFDSYFPEWVNYENKLANKTFFIEEFSTVPNIQNVRLFLRLTCVFSLTSFPFFNWAIIWNKKKTVSITWGKRLKAKWNNAEQIRA